MTSILFIIGRIYLNQFKWDYLKNKTEKLFFAGYLKSILDFIHLQIEDDPHRLCIWEFKECKRCCQLNV